MNGTDSLSGSPLHVLMLPDFDRADRIGEFWVRPEARGFAELLIDVEEAAESLTSSVLHSKHGVTPPGEWTKQGEGRVRRISGRMGEVLALRRAGLSQPQVAARLGISPGTVRTYSTSLRAMGWNFDRKRKHGSAGAASA